MYKLYGIPTQHTLKPAYVLDAVGIDYEYQAVDLPNGEHKEESYLKVNPIGKVPALLHNDFSLAESGAICRYIANTENSPLYPKDHVQRAIVDQWLDYISSHLGRWLSNMFFEKVIKEKFGLGEPDLAKCEEYKTFVDQQMQVVENQLSKSTYFAGKDITIADYAAYAYLDQIPAINYDLTAFPSTQKWHKNMSELNSVIKTKSKVKM